MKKFLILICALFVLSSGTVLTEDDGRFAIKQHVLNISGMQYVVFYDKYTRASGGVASSICIINVTKDKLETEKLKLEIEYFKNKNK